MPWKNLTTMIIDEKYARCSGRTKKWNIRGKKFGFLQRVAEATFYMNIAKEISGKTQFFKKIDNFEKIDFFGPVVTKNSAQFAHSGLFCMLLIYIGCTNSICNYLKGLKHALWCFHQKHTKSFKTGKTVWSGTKFFRVSMTTGTPIFDKLY